MTEAVSRLLLGRGSDGEGEINEGMGRGGGGGIMSVNCALGIKQRAWRDVVEGLMGKKRDVPPLIRNKISS